VKAVVPKSRKLTDDEIALAKLLRDDGLAFATVALKYEPHKGQLPIYLADLHKQETCIVAGRRWGKTYGLARKVGWDLFRLPGMQIYCYTPSEDQSHQLYDGVCRLYRTSDYLKRYVPSREKGGVFTVGSEPHESTLRILRVGGTGDNARGWGTDGLGYVIADESNAHYDAQVIADNIEPYINSGGGLVYMSSAGEADESNFFYRTYSYYKEMQEAGSKRHRVYVGTIHDAPHADPEIIESQRQKAIRNNRLWAWERENLGIFNHASGQYFDLRDIAACTQIPVTKGGRLDTHAWSFDPGGLGSPAVIHCGRVNQALNRIELVDVRSFKLTSSRKYRRDDGHELIEEYEDLIQVFINLRKQYSPSVVYYDPNCERHLTESLETRYGFPMKPIQISSYQAKCDFLEELKRALAERKLIWQDRRITEELERFCPPMNPRTNRYEYPSRLYDQIVCLGMLVAYFGDRLVAPYIVSVSKRKVADLW
jgi:hypothetical protein